MPHPFFERHRATLDRAVEAIAQRSYWSAYPESASPKVYGEGAAEAGKAAFDALKDKPFPLEQPGTVATVGGEISPYGIPLGITYPKPDLDTLFTAIAKAQASWRKGGPEAWAGVCLETLARINQQSFLFANAVMHTTGQAFMMAFQAGGPHAQDRGLEAVAYAWDEMRRIPATAQWEKPQGKNEPLKMEKNFRVVPRGIGLVIGCCTFPTWNGFPGLFADLATGNAVVVKPHPSAILPLALTVKIAREVLAEGGFDPNVVTLVAHAAGDAAQKLAFARRPHHRLHRQRRQRQLARGQCAASAGLHREIGRQPDRVDSVADFKGFVRTSHSRYRSTRADVHGAAESLYPADGIDTADIELRPGRAGLAVQKPCRPARAVDFSALRQRSC